MFVESSTVVQQTRRKKKLKLDDDRDNDITLPPFFKTSEVAGFSDLIGRRFIGDDARIKNESFDGNLIRNIHSSIVSSHALPPSTIIQQKAAHGPMFCAK